MLDVSRGVVARVYAFIKTHQIVHFKWIHFIVRKFCFNKADEKTLRKHIFREVLLFLPLLLSVLPEPACTCLQEPILCISAGSLKLTTLGVFTPRKVANLQTKAFAGFYFFQIIGLPAYRCLYLTYLPVLVHKPSHWFLVYSACIFL